MWLARGPSVREKADRALRDRITDIHSRSRGIYGAPRIHAELAAEGVSVDRKRVARLMRQARIQGVHRRRRVSTTKQNPEAAVAPDLVRRRFTASGPDRTWVADITYVPTGAGFLYLAVVLDLWSRKVVGWSMRTDLTTPLVTDHLGHGHPTAQTPPGDPPLGSGQPWRIQSVVATPTSEGGL